MPNAEIFWHKRVSTCLRLPKGDPEGAARFITKCSQAYVMTNGQWVRFESPYSLEPSETPCDKNCDAKCLVAQLAWR